MITNPFFESALMKKTTNVTLPYLSSKKKPKLDETSKNAKYEQLKQTARI
jgi:hypothetical protein